MRRLQAEKKVLYMVLCLIFFLAALSFILFFRYRTKSDSGLLISPSGKYNTSDFPCYQQKDLLCSEDRLGESGEMPPGNLNDLFTEKPEPAFFALLCQQAVCFFAWTKEYER